MAGDPKGAVGGMDKVWDTSKLGSKPAEDSSLACVGMNQIEFSLAEKAPKEKESEKIFRRVYFPDKERDQVKLLFSKVSLLPDLWGQILFPRSNLETKFFPQPRKELTQDAACSAGDQAGNDLADPRPGHFSFSFRKSA